MLGLLILKQTATDGTGIVCIGDSLALTVVELAKSLARCLASGEVFQPISFVSEDDGADTQSTEITS